MDKLPGALVAVVILAGVAWLMLRSWRRRTTRDAERSAYPVPAALAAAVLEAEVLYVATTPSGEPFERLAMAGLAFRGAGRIEVGPDGVLLRVAGEQPSFIPTTALVGVGAATHAIDRGVEPEGLVVIAWTPKARAGDSAEPAPTADSYLRAREPQDTARIIRAIHELIVVPEDGGHAAPDAARHEQESEDSDD